MSISAASADPLLFAFLTVSDTHSLLIQYESERFLLLGQSNNKKSKWNQVKIVTQEQKTPTRDLYQPTDISTDIFGLIKRTGVYCVELSSIGFS